LAGNRSFSKSRRPRCAFKPSKKVGGRSPPTFLDCLEATRTPKTTDFQPHPKPPSAKHTAGNDRLKKRPSTNATPSSDKAANEHGALHFNSGLKTIIELAVILSLSPASGLPPNRKSSIVNVQNCFNSLQNPFSGFWIDLEPF